MKNLITEAEVEEYFLTVLEHMGYEVVREDPDAYLRGDKSSLRGDYRDVVVMDRLREAVWRINPDVPESAREQAVKQAVRSQSQNLLADNESFHRMLADGVDVPVKTRNGERYNKVWLLDFKNPENNDFLAVSQLTVVQGQEHRRPDVVIFVNGLPLVVIELKNLADEQATIWSAYNQLQTYKKSIPNLFRFNEILIISDGNEARAGTITSNEGRFMQWKTMEGEKPGKASRESKRLGKSWKSINPEKAGKIFSETQVLIRGMLEKTRLPDLIRNFTVFEKEKETSKKLAAYHQYWATNKAIKSTFNARKSNKKAGVVWHTQGSGKSLTMVFYAGKLIRESDNPTIVVLTDRNDLDGQLFGTFSRCQDVLRQKPTQAGSRKELKKLLKVASGGVVFTTIQKFFPEEGRESYPVLSERENVIVIADEAHRSQYGFQAKIIDRKTDSKQEKHVAYGYAKYLRDALPNASFIGFTGTPIESTDRSTPAVFGKYIDVYDVERAVEDQATVRIYYESRLAKLELKPEERPKIDQKFEEVTETEETEGKEKLKSRWARVEKVAGSKKRIRRIAKDVIWHFEKRLKAMKGKGMLVAMSRRICVQLYDEITRLRPEWHGDDDDKGKIKVVMTGSASDPENLQPHIRNATRRKRIGDNLKDPEHELKLIIVRDMFLTGFDAPSLHTIYLDKMIKGHTLMQAIARVNRIYPGKKGGLIVDYMGVGNELKKAMMNYTESGGKGKPAFDQEQAVKLMLEKYEVVRDMFHGFNYRKFFELKPGERLSFFPAAMEHVLKEKGKKERFSRQVTALLQAYSLSVPNEKATKIEKEVGLFQAIKAAINKTTGTKAAREEFDYAINQILSKAVISDRIIDVFEAAGIQKPELSILSDGFLAEVREMPQKNLAFEALKKLLNDQIRLISGKKMIQAKSFMDMLETTIRKYTNRNIEAAEAIEELIELGKKVREEKKRGKNLNMNEDEIAFYDALEVNDSAVKILGDKTLRHIALELTEMIRKSATIDWTQRENVRAEIRLKVKRILKRYGYPPDKQKKATKTVLEQAELMAGNTANQYLFKAPLKQHPV